jgi:hypothetical protein
MDQSNASSMIQTQQHQTCREGKAAADHGIPRTNPLYNEASSVGKSSLLLFADQNAIPSLAHKRM